jgi:hypothetical protein
MNTRRNQADVGRGLRLPVYPLEGERKSGGMGAQRPRPEAQGVTPYQLVKEAVRVTGPPPRCDGMAPMGMTIRVKLNPRFFYLPGAGGALPGVQAITNKHKEVRDGKTD